MTLYPLTAVRTLSLHTQGLTTPNGSEPPAGPDSIMDTITRLGALQIDTLQMVARAQYLTLWSRLGNYNRSDLDRLAYHPAERQLFEGWQHAACYIPLKDYRYQMPRQRRLRERHSPWYANWLNENHNHEVVEYVRQRVRQEGALKVSDFERGDHPPGTWWNWRPAKAALEFLYAFGEFMIADRVNFQRVYDLTERVLPDWVDTTEPTVEERDRDWVELGGRALGVFDERHACQYTHMKITKGRPHVRDLIESGVFVPIRAILNDGQAHDELFVHRDNLSLLEQAADGALTAERTTFLNPFDSLFYGWGRDEAFWGFWQHIEAYVPAAKRRYGYFCLPILHREKLVGRFDPKLERKDGLLRLKAVYLEPGVEPDEALVAAVAAAMRDFMQFHAAKDLVIEKSDPPEFGEKLLRTLS